MDGCDIFCFLEIRPWDNLVQQHWIRFASQKKVMGKPFRTADNRNMLHFSGFWIDDTPLKINMALKNWWLK